MSNPVAEAEARSFRSLSRDTEAHEAIQKLISRLDDGSSVPRSTLIREVATSAHFAQHQLAETLACEHSVESVQTAITNNQPILPEKLLAYREKCGGIPDELPTREPGFTNLEVCPSNPILEYMEDKYATANIRVGERMVPGGVEEKFARLVEENRDLISQLATVIARKKGDSDAANTNIHRLEEMIYSPTTQFERAGHRAPNDNSSITKNKVDYEQKPKEFETRLAETETEKNKEISALKLTIHQLKKEITLLITKLETANNKAFNAKKKADQELRDNRFLTSMSLDFAKHRMVADKGVIDVQWQKHRRWVASLDNFDYGDLSGNEKTPSSSSSSPSSPSSVHHQPEETEETKLGEGFEEESGETGGVSLE